MSETDDKVSCWMCAHLYCNSEDSPPFFECDARTGRDNLKSFPFKTTKCDMFKRKRIVYLEIEEDSDE
jgi:hypothetical protein